MESLENDENWHPTFIRFNNWSSPQNMIFDLCRWISPGMGSIWRWGKGTPKSSRITIWIPYINHGSWSKKITIWMAFFWDGYLPLIHDWWFFIGWRTEDGHQNNIKIEVFTWVLRSQWDGRRKFHLHLGEISRRQDDWIIYPLVICYIALENGPFTDDFPNKTSIYNGCSIAMLNYQRVLGKLQHSQMVAFSIMLGMRGIMCNVATQLCATLLRFK